MTTDNLDISPYVVHEQYLADHRKDNLRSGEGCVVELADGSLFMVYGRFAGGRDHDPATLVQQHSTDGGKTWSKAKKFISTPKNVLNIMSVSLLQLADGRLACVYLQKASFGDCRPRILFSSNQGKTWSKPLEAITKKDQSYYVVNNDRLVQLSTGRLLLPFTNHGEDVRNKTPTRSGCFYTDDAGKTWQLGTQQGIEPANVARPRKLDKTNADTMKLILKKKELVCQEPGVVELPDGRVMIWCRTNGGYMYHAFSKDGGVTFSPFKALRVFAMPCGPQSIKRLPGSDRLVMLYNDRREVPLGDFQFHWRRTLDIAVSDDNAKSWRRLGLLEPESVPSTCYYSICFHKKNAVFTYYEGNMLTRPNGIVAPNNLRSLKLKIIKQTYLKK